MSIPIQALLQPDNRDQNLIKVFGEEGTLVCGFNIPREIP
jgi:hypothetical protein